MEAGGGSGGGCRMEREAERWKGNGASEREKVRTDHAVVVEGARWSYSGREGARWPEVA